MEIAERCCFNTARARTGFRSAAPAVGMFADQEIRLLRGPLFAGENYRHRTRGRGLERQPPDPRACGCAPTVFAADKPVATMLLNLASIKDSYANYQREHKRSTAKPAR